MKKESFWAIVPAALTVLFGSIGVALSNPAVVEIGASQNAPIALNGQSGGIKNTKDCGFIAKSPNQQVRIGQRMDYLRFSVQSSGEPTLLVEGPGGRFCVMADTASGEKLEISGVWLPGTYSVYVGDRAGGQHPYTLSISQKVN